MVVFVSGSVVNACYLTDEEAQKVRQYAEDNDTTLEVAVNNLYNQGKIDLYRDCTESDYHTEAIEQVDDYEE